MVALGRKIKAFLDINFGSLQDGTEILECLLLVDVLSKAGWCSKFPPETLSTLYSAESAKASLLLQNYIINFPLIPIH